MKKTNKIALISTLSLVGVGVIYLLLRKTTRATPEQFSEYMVKSAIYSDKMFGVDLDKLVDGPTRQKMLKAWTTKLSKKDGSFLIDALSPLFDLEGNKPKYDKIMKKFNSKYNRL
jgi:hypothetical protein